MEVLEIPLFLWFVIAFWAAAANVFISAMFGRSEYDEQTETWHKLPLTHPKFIRSAKIEFFTTIFCFAFFGIAYECQKSWFWPTIIVASLIVIGFFIWRLVFVRRRSAEV
jgi:hypothetical protein